MDKKQKEALVLALYEKGKTYREIIREAGVSPNTIKAVVNKAGLDQNTSITSRIYELYSQQKSPLQVAIALGLKAEDAIRYHQEFYMLLGCTEFTKLYLRIKDDPWPFVNLVKLALDAGMDEVQVLELLKIANSSLPNVRLEYDRLEAERRSLEANVQRSARILQEIIDRTSKESKALEQYRSICNQLKEEIENLINKRVRLENAIGSFQNNNETYIKIKQMIKQEIESIISNPRRLLQFALVSIFESSRKHPGKLHAMYYNMPTIRTMERSKGDSHHQDIQYEQYSYQHTNEYDTCENILLDEAEQLYNRMIEESMNMCNFNKITINTKMALPHSLQLLPDLIHHQTMEEDRYTNSDPMENRLPIVTVGCENTDSLTQQDENDNC
jgi:predicted transcriptional regulator